MDVSTKGEVKNMNTGEEYAVLKVCPGNVGTSLCTRWKIVVLSAACLASAVPQLFAAEQTRTTERASEQYARNMAELFLGVTYEEAHYESDDGFTMGFTYERRLSNLLGIGGFYEYAAGDFKKWSIGIPLFIHPYGGWRFDLAPGLEHRGGDDEFLLRTGVAYEFELSEQWVMVPEFNVDFVDGEEAFVLGLSFGFGF